jgi:hypothetical protein
MLVARDDNDLHCGSQEALREVYLGHWCSLNLGPPHPRPFCRRDDRGWSEAPGEGGTQERIEK